MALSPVATLPIPKRVEAAVDTLIQCTARTPLQTLFQRHLNVSDENSTRRNVAFSVLTEACLSSKKAGDLPDFEGFNTDECQKAVTTLAVYYRVQYKTETAENFLDKRINLFQLFQNKLTQQFGAENTDSIPARYASSKILGVREILFQAGAALQVTPPSIDGSIPIPEPFRAVLTPLEQLEKKGEVDLSNPWIGVDGEPYPEYLKKAAYFEILRAVFSPDDQPVQFVTAKIESYRFRFPSSLKETWDCFCARGLPIRITVSNGETRDLFWFTDRTPTTQN